MIQRLLGSLRHFGRSGPLQPFNQFKSSSRSGSRLLSSLLILLILSISALLGACKATPPEEVEVEAPEPSADTVLEEALYNLMAEDAELDVVTAAWLKALEAAEDEQAKDRLTSRWFDHAKYKTSVLSRALYSEDGDMGSPLFDVYNTLFERQWDAAKIKDIEDPALRRYFEVLDQSYMRMVEYGEYVGPGFDFDRLSKLSALADGFKTYFSLSSSYYGFLTESYQTGLLPYNAFVDYTLKVEEALEASASPYQTVYLEPLLRWSYSMLFSGTMGSGPFNYETNTLNPEFEDLLKGAIERAPDSGLAELASKVIDLPDGSDASEYAYVDAVQNFRRFGFDSPKGIKAIYNYKHPTFYESRPELFGFEDPQVMAALEGNLNATMEELKEKVAWGQNPKASYNLGFYLEFANDRWASFQLAASSFDPETEVNVNYNEPAVFDLTTGERVTLDEFLGDPSGAAADKLEAILIEQAKQYMDLPSTVQVDLSQRFSLGEDYILAMLLPKTLSEAQAYDMFVDVRYGLAFPEVDVRARLLP
ncbi:hypothetical protein [Acidaminobacter sp.]|uniref:hypothetical protein n=1 Tax=Acidaminobacter sp. TaxID=1872102 RepID=UPI00256225EA|nr:hypothetical protein [Acidaminobacter sp.]MDK9711966.1 hypothetical protein [Acidaminobacter sp.]